MRVRPVPVIASVFAAAALTTAFVVSQLPREGQVSPVPKGPAAVVAALTSPPLEPPAAAADGALEVRVTAGGEPQAGAAVRLYVPPAAPGAPWRRAGEARTDAAGRAALPARPGSYLVAARADGLAPGRAQALRAGGEDPSRAAVELAPAAALDGRVTGPAGAPIAGARLRAIPLVSAAPGVAPPSAPPEEIALASSGADGAFRMAGLAPGSYAVEIEARGYHPALRPEVAVPGEPLAVALEPLGAIDGAVLLSDGHPAAGAEVRAASVDHAARAVTGADGRYVLAAPAGRYAVRASLGGKAGGLDAAVPVAAGETSRAGALRLGPAAAVEGRVALPSGAPAPGAQVALFVHETADLAAHAVTGPDGAFALRDLAPGAYDLRAAAPGTSPVRVAGVTLAEGASFPVRLVLVEAGAAAGTVRDGAGRPLAGVRVRAVQRGDGLPAAAPREARTGFDGRFRLAGLEVGRAELVATQDGVDLGAGRAVQIAPGRSAEVDLVLPEPGRLAGRVSDAGRRPPAGTAVVASPLRAGPGVSPARAAVDATGNYRLDLPAGEYRVHAAPAGAHTDLRAAPSFVRVEAGRTTALDLPFTPAAAASGIEILVLEPGGAPSPGAVVTLSRPDDGRVALAVTAGDDGRVAVDARMGLAGREVTVRARNGGRSGSRTVALPETGTVPVSLSPGGVLEGVVRGGGVKGFTVEVSSQPAAGSWRTVDVHRFAGDRFAVADLPAEPLRVVVRSDDGRRGSTEVRIGPGETQAVEIALR